VIGFVALLAFVTADDSAHLDDDVGNQRQDPVSGSLEVSRLHLRFSDDGTVENSDCLALAGSSESNSRLMSDRQDSDMQAFFESLAEQGFGKLQRQLVADLAGVDPFSIESRYKSPREVAYSAYLVPLPRTPRVTLTMQRRLDEALKSSTLDEWVRVALNDPGVLRKRWSPTVLGGASLELRQTSVLGHVLRSRGVDLQAHLHELPAGSFGVHELAVGIAVGMPTDRFLEVLERGDVDPGETWTHHRLHRNINLSVVAAFNARSDILRALMDRGVEPSSESHSVLDELAVYPVDHGSMPEILRLVANANDQPFFPSTIETLKRRFPTSPVWYLRADAIGTLATPGIERSAERLASIAEEWEPKIAEARRVEERCGQTWLGAADVATESLVAKMRHEGKSSRRLDREMGGASENARSVLDDAAPAFLKSMGGLREALTAQDWSKVLRLADEAVVTFPEGVDPDGYYVTLLYTALRSGAPMDVVRALIDRTGGSLLPNAVMALVGGDWEGSLAMAMELERVYGLDVHFVNDYGRNAISKVVERFRAMHGTARVDDTSVQWLDYLMSRSVTPKPSALGLDPMDTVLLAIAERPALASVGVSVLRLLLNSGAPIQASHRELAQLILGADSEAFELLVAAIPAFMIK
jgi:hypothetical protein